MRLELEPVDKGPRSIFELITLTQLPGIVDDLLNTTFNSEDELLELIEGKGFRIGEGLLVDIPEELKDTLQDYVLKRHSIIDEKDLAVATVGVLIGDKEKLDKLNKIIETWFQGVPQATNDQQANS